MKKIFLLAAIVVLIVGGWMFFAKYESRTKVPVSSLPSVSGNEVETAKEGFSAGSPSSLLRIIEPIRLSPQQGSALDGEIAQTRQILEKFQRSGYNCALWVVDSFPAKDEDMKSWAEFCLKVFPGQVLIALDAELENGAVSLEKSKLKSFLKSILVSSQVSILLNYTRLDNFHCPESSESAIKAVADTARVVKEVSPKTFCWLLLDDHPAAAGKIPAWTKELDRFADGYYLNRGHGLNVLKDSSFTSVAGLDSSKPVIRGGFIYSAPRVRPGIEKDLLEQYRDRMSRYECWLSQNKYAGFSREIGESAPAKIALNLMYAPGI